MFEFALLIGIYSYCIFLLGILGLLYKNIIIISLIIYLVLTFLIFRNYKFGKLVNKILISSKWVKFLLFLLVTQVIINFIGVLGPEMSFDALWYHLTLPKIYLLNHKVFHIPGGLLYYSDIPKNIEMLYVSALSIGNEILAKFTHFMLGVLTLVVIYKTARKFLTQEYSLLSCIIFYSNLVVGWESISAYIDLGTVFFTSVAFYYLIDWLQLKNRTYLIKSAVIVGFAIATKVVTLNLLPIYSILIILIQYANKQKLKSLFYDLLWFNIIAVFVSLPWFVFSYLNTGNPIYPLFSPVLNINNVIHFSNLINLFIFNQDPINPLYLISIPLIIAFYINNKLIYKVFCVYILLALIMWFIDSEIGGSRFFLPYLSVYSVLIMITVSLLKNHLLKRFMIILIILISFISISYRFVANAKFIPIIIGAQSKDNYLTKHLNYDFGDFYDIDGYFKNHIKSSDRVLLFGFHNLYYVDFPFIDSTFIKKGDRFNYIATQNSKIPNKYKNWKKIYYNKITKVSLYNLEGQEWVY